MFPAYNRQSDSNDKTGENNDWLVNSSFQLVTTSADNTAGDSLSTKKGDLEDPSLPETDLTAEQKSTLKDFHSDSPCKSPSALSDFTKDFDNSTGTSDTNLEKSSELKIDRNVRDSKPEDKAGEQSSLNKERKEEGGKRTYRSTSSSDGDKSGDEDGKREKCRRKQKSRSRRKKHRDSSTSSSRDGYRKISGKYKKEKDKKQSTRQSRSFDKEGKEGSRSKKRCRSGSSSSDSSKERKNSSNKGRKRRRKDSDRSSSSRDRGKRSRSRRRSNDRSTKRNQSRDRGKEEKKRGIILEAENRKNRNNLIKNIWETDKVPSELFYEDRERDVNNLLVSKLSRPVAALCFVRYRTLGLSKHSEKALKRRKKSSRYFEVLRDPARRAEILGEGGEWKDLESFEEERSTKTAYFNRTLAEDPCNVKLWIDYIDFQDMMRTKRHLSGGDPDEDAAEHGREIRRIDRPTVERKLSIVEKALESNPDSEELLERRCRYAEIVLPDEKYREELSKWATQHPSHISLWRSLLFNTQSSLSACRSSVVCKLGANAMEQLHALRRSKRATPSEIAQIEHKILTLLLDLGLFLRQAGLSELLWSLLNLYLELNLARLEKDKFQISSCVPEKDLRDLEDAVLSSEMPMPTLWMRVETLRAGVHWLSLDVEEDCEDPQRMVLPEDTADLVQPVRTSSLQMRLVLTVLTLLKVPLLPWRDMTHRSLGLNDVPWALDGPEPLLASVFRSGALEVRRTASALVDSIQIASGAQYLATRPGQDQYIEFLCSVFLSCADCLPVREQTMTCVWWLRFCRFLLQLDAWKLFTLPRGRSKKLRSAAKDLLKKEQNRHNVPLFCEFALLEREISGVEAACKVLRGAISVLPTHTPVPALSDRGPVCALYRTLVDLLISLNEREKAKAVLVSVGNGSSLTEDTPSASAIEKALSKYHHVSTELLVELESLGEADEDDGAIYTFHLGFDFFVEWLTCQAWLLFLTDSVWKAVGMLENAISTIASQARMIASRREALWEVYGYVLGLHCRDTCGSYGVLRDAVLRGLKEFPANMTLVGILCDIETNDLGGGLPQWQLSRSLCAVKSPAAHALLVFLIRFRVQNREGTLGLRRMTTLLRRLTRSSNPNCPLLWRIYLQLVSAVGDDKTLKNTWYLALEGCPWVKALYLDAVQSMPSELGRIQDLLQEKELRLHVTPEELDILRAD